MMMHCGHVLSGPMKILHIEVMEVVHICGEKNEKTCQEASSRAEVNYGGGVERWICLVSPCFPVKFVVYL